ncbi:MAG: hypothetical protein ACLT1K_04205 [[Clostridium] leptum]
MKEERHVIWSNYGLDYEDWRDDLEADYPDLSEDERISLMYEINGDYLDDERANLNVQLSQPILVVGDLGLWNGRRMEVYKRKIPGGSISGLPAIPDTVIPPGMWTGWVICGATPSTMMARTFIFTAFTRTAPALLKLNC